MRDIDSHEGYSSSIDDLNFENQKLSKEKEELEIKLKSVREGVNSLTLRNAELLLFLNKVHDCQEDWTMQEVFELIQKSEKI